MWSSLVMLMSLMEVRAILQMRLAGVFDEDDTQQADLFRQAVEDVNNNR